MFKAIFVGLTIALLPLPAIAALTYSEVLDGRAVLSRQGTLYNIGPGTRLYEGDVVNVPSQLRFILPYGAATVTKRKGLVRFLLSRRESCGIRVHIVYGGGIGAYARPKTCQTSSIVFESFLSGAFFNPWVNTRRGTLIPGSLIAQILPIATGASFALADRDNTSILSVQSGEVESQNENAIVPVFGGQGNVTPKGKPPGPAIGLDEALELGWGRPTITPTGFRPNVRINPLNTLLVQGIEFKGGEIPWPVLGNSLRVEVRSADGVRSRVHVRDVPRRR